MQGNPRGNGGAEEERVGECVGKIHSKVNYRSRDNKESQGALHFLGKSTLQIWFLYMHTSLFCLTINCLISTHRNGCDCDIS